MEKGSHINSMPATSPVDGQMEIRARNKKFVVRKSFAGRVGGNQEFIADPNNEETDSILRKQPDAAPLATLSASLDLRGFLEPDLWRMAVIEGWGTFMLISLLGAVASGLTTTDQSVFAQTLYGAFVGFLALTLFTFAFGPITGAHLNPAITMATFFAGLSTLPRAVFYIVAQTCGAVVAGGWLKLSLGDAYFPKGVIPGCTVDPSQVSPGQLFALEYMFSQVLICIAFAVGLDPRQGKTISPAFAPVLVGFVLGLGNLCSGIAKPGYSGVSFNPARCLGLMAAKHNMQYHYVHWLGPLAAAILNAMFYFLAPPWAREVPLSTRILNRLSQAMGKSHV